MDFKKLAKCYEALVSTAKKLEKRDIVANFIKETPTGLLAVVVTLLEGSVFPAWMETELGVAENIMFKALAKVTGLTEDEVKNEAKKAGDIGTAAETILKKKKQKTLFAKPLTVESVYKNLTKIPTLTGGGSTGQKVSLIAELVSNATPEEGKYVVRLILEEMRIGVGEGTIREALAVAYEIEPDLIDKAYSVRNDYGEVAKLIRSGGKKALEKVELEVGRPLKPMLAQKVDTAAEGLEEMKGNAAFQYKYDGMRVQIHKDRNKISVFTRRLDNITKQFPELIEAAKKLIRADTAIIEGEAVGIDPKSRKPQPFQKLSQRIKRKYGIEEMQKQIPVEMNIFDLLYVNGVNLLDTPYEKRWKKLTEIVKETSDFHLAENLVTADSKKADEFYKKAMNLGHEGLMIKNLGAKYMPGSRVKYMYKLKQERETLDLAIIGAIWGEGRRSKWLGSFVLGVRDSDSGEFLGAGKVATGLTDEDLENLTNLLKPLITKEHIKDVEVRPKIVVEIGFEEIQKSPHYRSGYALRFPRVKRIRDDKGVEDADDLERLSRLYEGQRKAKK
ncbi:TPA: ATP-dependent DNA ligase [archaeon]|nr:ATP-dependent DNA ligase [Candidatus Naiadarchaeales archaeon SRR2090159.bin1288]